MGNAESFRVDFAVEAEEFLAGHLLDLAGSLVDVRENCRQSGLGFGLRVGNAGHRHNGRE